MHAQRGALPGHGDARRGALGRHRRHDVRAQHLGRSEGVPRGACAPKELRDRSADPEPADERALRDDRGVPPRHGAERRLTRVDVARYRRSRGSRLLGAGVAAWLAACVAACGGDGTPSATPPSGERTETGAATELADAGELPVAPPRDPSRTVCLMTDVRGDFDDGSYVSTLVEGVRAARAAYGWKDRIVEPAADTAEAFHDRLDALAGSGCDLLVVVSPLYSTEVLRVARAHPEAKFQTIDLVPAPELPNVWGQGYEVSEASYLAGFVAAGASRTGTVGTFGALDIAPIHAFMDGFALGVRAYNERFSETVDLVGWDPSAQTGTFTGSFTDTAKARAAAIEELGRGRARRLRLEGPHR
ncbi:BMP family ABC transporter substrate-binding protein, partial [bacterium]